MLKRIFLSGALGGLMLLLWTAVANVGFGLSARVTMHPLPNERAIYAMLKDAVIAPGVYMANPDPVPTGAFPAGEPVFSVLYSGVGHDAAGRLLFLDPLLAFGVALLAAGLLSVTSDRVLARYSRKVLFITGIGLLLAVSGDVARFGIGGYPLGSALLLGANRVGSWVLAGLVMAWSMRTPGEAAATT